MRTALINTLTKVRDRFLTMDDFSEQEINRVVELHRDELVQYTHDMNRGRTFVWITDAGKKALRKKRGGE